MKKFKLNITSKTQEFESLEQTIRVLIEYTTESEFIVRLDRTENETPEDTQIEIEVEYPLIGKILIRLSKEYDNLNFEKSTNWELSHIMNKVLIIGV